MRSTSSLLDRLRLDYPQFIFQNAHVARWSSRDKTVYFASIHGHGAITLLHELGHAIRGHVAYNQDIELLRYEREAWQTAHDIAPNYGITITDEIIEQAMLSYQVWLHDRSRCPQCNSGAHQSSDSLSYQCLLCGIAWHANDARQCGLRRYTHTKNTP